MSDYITTKKEIGARLKSARLLKAMSQQHMADQVGLTFQQIQKYENGKNHISAARLLQFANILSMPVLYFYGDTSFASPEILRLLQSKEAADLLRHWAALPEAMRKNHISIIKRAHSRMAQEQAA